MHACSRNGAARSSPGPSTRSAHSVPAITKPGLPAESNVSSTSISCPRRRGTRRTSKRESSVSSSGTSGSDQRLSRVDRRYVTVPCVGVSDALMPIHSHVGSALGSGDISMAEMNELILQFAAYSGFAKAEVLNQVAAEEWARVQEPEGLTPTTAPIRPQSVPTPSASLRLRHSTRDILVVSTSLARSRSAPTVACSFGVCANGSQP